MTRMCSYRETDLVLGSPRRKTAGLNAERDKFVIEQYQAGEPVDWIIAEVKKRQGWSNVGTHAAIEAILKRYEKRYRIIIPRRKQSRRKRGGA